MGPETCIAALVLRMQKCHIHHRVLPPHGGILHQNAKAGSTQGVDTGGNARVTANHLLGHVGQAQALADDAKLDMPLENLRQGLGARFSLRVAGRHAVADVQVANDVHREPRRSPIALTHIGNGTNTALDVAGIEFHQTAGIDRAFGVVQTLQLRVKQSGRPGLTGFHRKPALLRVMHKGPIGDIGSQVVMRPEIVGRKALHEFAQRTGQTGQPRRTLAVGKEQRAIAVPDVHRPDTLHRIEPAALLDVESQRLQTCLQGVDGGL